ncbi:MAG: hypothetical protein KAS86_03065 [Candidatus Omnitrophica bacterium]|nr:hypothetical protein [Candidatus Omnitrophota bacterium]
MRTRQDIFMTIVLLSIVFLTGGCVSYPENMGDVFGVGHTDLEKARSTGITKEIDLPRDKTFDKITGILKAGGLTIYQSNPDKGYIIVMGFPKQTDTTRVGIFFESAGQGRTSVTLSSLSSTALKKADRLILEKL